MDLCCKDMKFFLKDRKDPVFYDKKFREFYLNSGRKDSSVIYTLSFCPWCGIKLPSSLRDEYFEYLEKDYGLDLALDEIKGNNKVPAEFKTDEWWKKRGL